MAVAPINNWKNKFLTDENGDAVELASSLSAANSIDGSGIPSNLKTLLLNASSAFRAAKNTLKNTDKNNSAAIAVARANYLKAKKELNKALEKVKAYTSRNNKLMSGFLDSQIMEDPRSKYPEWLEFTYEQIIGVSEDGQYVPEEVLAWAHSMANTEIDDNSYEIAEENENEDKTGTDGKDLRESAKEHIAACEDKNQKIDKALEKFTPLADEMNRIADELTNETGEAAGKINDLNKEWKKLENKQTTEGLTTSEQERFEELGRIFDDEKNDLKKITNGRFSSLEDISGELNRLDALAKGHYDYGEETADIGSQIIQQQAKHKSTMRGIYVGLTPGATLGSIVSASRNRNLARTAIQKGSETMEFTEDAQLDLNEMASMLDITIQTQQAAQEESEQVDDESEVNDETAVETQDPEDTEAPATEEPAAEEEIPTAKEEVPMAEEEVPLAAEEVPPAAEEVPPAKEEVPMAAEEIPTAEEEVPAAEEEVPPAEEEVPAAEEEVPMAEEEIPTAAEEVPAAAEEVPPAEEEIPAAEEVPPAEETPTAQGAAEDDTNLTAAQKARKQMQEEGMSLRDQAITFTDISKTEKKENFKKVFEMVKNIMEAQGAESAANAAAYKAAFKSKSMKKEYDDLVKRFKDKGAEPLTDSEKQRIITLGQNIKKLGVDGQQTLTEIRKNLNEMDPAIIESFGLVEEAEDFGSETVDIGSQLIDSAKGFIFSTDFWVGLIAIAQGVAAINTGELNEKATNKAQETKKESIEVIQENQQKIEDATHVGAKAAPAENTGETEEANGEETTDGKTEEGEQTETETTASGGVVEKEETGAPDTVEDITASGDTESKQVEGNTEVETTASGNEITKEDNTPDTVEDTTASGDTESKQVEENTETEITASGTTIAKETDTPSNDPDTSYLDEIEQLVKKSINGEDKQNGETTTTDAAGNTITLRSSDNPVIDDTNTTASGTPVLPTPPANPNDVSALSAPPTRSTVSLPGVSMPDTTPDYNTTDGNGNVTPPPSEEDLKEDAEKKQKEGEEAQQRSGSQRDIDNTKKGNASSQDDGKAAQNDDKDMQKTDEQLKKEIKAAQNELKRIEAKLNRIGQQCEAAGEQILTIQGEAEQQQQQQEANPQAPVTSQDFNSQIGALQGKLTSGKAQAVGLNAKARRLHKKINKKIKIINKRADDKRKEQERKAKVAQKWNDTLTTIGYVMTGTKLAGKIMFGIGTPMVPPPPTTVAGTALVTIGGYMTSIGTYGGIACDVGKAIVAVTQGNLMGALISCVSAAASCVGGLPKADGGAKAVIQAGKAAQEAATTAATAASTAATATVGASIKAMKEGTQGAMNNALQASMHSTVANAAAREAAKGIAKATTGDIAKSLGKELAKEYFKGDTTLKTIMKTTGTLGKVAGIGMDIHARNEQKKAEAASANKRRTTAGYTDTAASRRMRQRNNNYVASTQRMNNGSGSFSGGGNRPK
jgi:hypothetical protein